MPSLTDEKMRRRLQNELLQPGGTPVSQVSLDPCLPDVPAPLSPRCPCTQGTKQRSAVRLSLQPRLLPPRTPVPELRDTYIPSHLEAFCLPFLLPRTPYHPLPPGAFSSTFKAQLRGTSPPQGAHRGRPSQH